jgi:hypothetical protein
MSSSFCALGGQPGGILPASLIERLLDSNTAYDVWLAMGNTGSRLDFIQAITGPVGPQGVQGPQGLVGPIGPVGPQGAQGIQGVQGIKGDKGDKGDTGDIGLTGPQGLQGPQGIQGIQGPAGELWFYGTGAPATGTGKIGDWYLRSNGDVHEKTGTSTWTLRFNIMGPQGPTGPTGPEGPTGPQGPQGIQGPAVSLSGLTWDSFL